MSAIFAPAGRGDFAADVSANYEAAGFFAAFSRSYF